MIGYVLATIASLIFLYIIYMNIWDVFATVVVILMSLFIARSDEMLKDMTFASAAFLGSTLVHEAGHWAVARFLGYEAVIGAGSISMTSVKMAENVPALHIAAIAAAGPLLAILFLLALSLRLDPLEGHVLAFSWGIELAQFLPIFIATKNGVIPMTDGAHIVYALLGTPIIPPLDPFTAQLVFQVTVLILIIIFSLRG